MLSKRDGKGTLRLIVVGLYLLLSCAVVQTVLVLYLFAARSVDATNGATLILAFSSSQVSLIFISVHASIARRTRGAVGYSNRRRLKMKLVRRSLPRLLILLWMVTAAVGIIVAARRPSCLSGVPLEHFWEVGLSCRIHRTIVAMAVLAFIITCTVFSSMEVSSRPYHASLFGITEPAEEATPGMKLSSSGHSWLSSSSLQNQEKLQQHHPPADLEAANSRRALWLQRQNSLSSQSAVYPAGFRYFPPGPVGMSCQGNRPSLYCTPSLSGQSGRSISLTSTRTPSATEFGLFNSSSPPTRTASALSSASRSSSSTSTRPSPLSTMRRVSEPEVPVIPPHFLGSHNTKPVQRSPTLPCSWSPALSHAPLSADPAIKAFSTEIEASEASMMAIACSKPPSATDKTRIGSTRTTTDCNLRKPSASPELPARARGHSLPLDIALNNTLPNSVPPSQVSNRATRSRTSAAPSSNPAPSSLSIPRTRPLVPTFRKIDNNNNNKDENEPIQRPQPILHLRSADGSKKRASVSPCGLSSNGSATSTHDTSTLDDRLMKRWWSLARGRIVGAQTCSQAIDTRQNVGRAASTARASRQGRFLSFCAE